MRCIAFKWIIAFYIWQSMVAHETNHLDKRKRNRHTNYIMLRFLCQIVFFLLPLINCAIAGQVKAFPGFACNFEHQGHGNSRENYDQASGYLLDPDSLQPNVMHNVLLQRSPGV